MPIDMNKLVNLTDAKAGIDTEHAMIATVESSTTASKAHAVGDYFYLAGKLYITTSAISSGGTITVNTNCKLAVLGDNVSDLKNDVASQSEKLNTFYTSQNVKTSWVQGTINGSTGNGSTSTTRCRSISIPYVAPVHIVIPSGYKLYAYKYTTIRPYGSVTSKYVGRITDNWVTGTLDINITTGQMYKLVVAKSDDSSITPEDVPTITQTINARPMDYSKAINIAMFGDSITAGRIGGESAGSRDFITIPQWVSAKLNVNATNYGVSSQGWTTPTGETALEKVQSVDLKDFDYVSLAYGINDTSAVLGTYTDTTEDTIMGAVYRVCNYIKTYGCTIILITPLLSISGGSFPTWGYTVERGPDGNHWTLEDFTEQFTLFSEKYHVHLIRGDLCFNSFNIEDMVGDNVHPTVYGYYTAGKYIASQIGKLI